MIFKQNDKLWIEAVLDSFSFVKWDRFVYKGKAREFVIYGWIDRADMYKDFLVLILTPHKRVGAYVTSSLIYHSEIVRILFNKDTPPNCQRVEDVFNTHYVCKQKKEESSRV